MQEIPLTQGKVALVDDADYEWLSQWKWTASLMRTKWYAVRGVGGRLHHKTLLMHRVIINAPENVKVDHWDGDGLNNQRINLRESTTAQNGYNRGRQKNNTSGFKGVHWSSQKNKYQARIKVGLRHIHLGFFADPSDAAHAYDEAARKHHGPFARTNFQL